ncbi:sensor histidine kinase [Aeromicrobium sp. UC242_57]|uniref:sensor histidine kinase n=1 Tax=Aeromicrobium sp. UC242_57 TaxID=3374624 RepID=UPI0037B30EED
MLDLERRWVRPGPTPAQVRHDTIAGVAAAVLSVASVEVWHSGYGSSLGWKGVEGYLLFAVAGLLLALRRRLPLLTLAGESALFITIGIRLEELGVIFTIQMILFVSLYSAWAWSRAPRRLYATSVAVILAMFGWLAWEFATTTPPRMPHEGLIPPYAAAITYSLMVNVVYFFGAMAWGHGAWRSARQRAELAARVDDERRAQVVDRERAVQAERVRIARDLHDVVAHHVSGIGIQAAGASRVLSSRPEDAGLALEVIERSSRQAVQQMHRLVGLLRADDERSDRGPQPGLADLGSLASPDGRPVVTFRQVGEPFDVPPTVALSLFRIAQEAVANLRRHADAGHGEVVLRYAAASDSCPASVEVEVIDDGKALGSTVGQDGSGGFGLAGVRERAVMHAGSCEIGPRPEGGFRVRVRIPVAV